MRPIAATQLPLPPLRGCGNDYGFIERALDEKGLSGGLDDYVPSSSLSVVIAVLDRAELLRLSLESIGRQQLRNVRFEILVVDDGSGPEVRRVCEESEIESLRYVRRDPDPRFTESAARNLGIRMAKNDVILQLDPEILFPDEDSMLRILRWFETGAEVAVTVPRLYVESAGIGPEHVRAGRTPIAMTGESDEREYLFGDPGAMKHRHMPFLEMLGFCMAYRREAALLAGGWAEEWTNYGGADQEFAYRLYQRGAYCIYERAAPALHLRHPVASKTGAHRDFLADRVPPYRAHRYPGIPPTRPRVPRVSIYVPAYNVASFIGEALTSAREQTFEDIEICVCDDGSTDGTADVIADQAREDGRIRWTRTAHRGCGAASNAAVALSQGEFLLQLDGDDVLDRECAEVLLAELDRAPFAGLAFGNLVRTDEKLRPVAPGHVFQRYRRFHMLMCMPVTAPRMWRRRLHALAGGWSEDLTSAIDYDFFLKMAELAPFRHVDRVLYHYRRRDHCLSSDPDEQFSNAERAVERSLGRMGLSKRFRVASGMTGRARWYEYEKVESPAAADAVLAGEVG